MRLIASSNWLFDSGWLGPELAGELDEEGFETDGVGTFFSGIGVVGVVANMADGTDRLGKDDATGVGVEAFSAIEELSETGVITDPKIAPN